MSAPDPLPSLSAVPAPVLARFTQAFAAQQQATLALWRATAAAYQAAAPADRGFVADELAVVMRCHPSTAEVFVITTLHAAELPALLVAWEAGHLTDRHVKAAVDQLHACLATHPQRQEVLDLVLDRCRARAAGGQPWPTPGELQRMIRLAALVLDPYAATRRKEQASADRGVHAAALPDGQAMLSLEGPEEHVAVMREAIRVRARAALSEPGETRTLSQLEFDLAAQLLVTGTLDPDVPGHPTGPAAAAAGVHVEAQVVMTLGTATGEREDPGELPDLGPVLASTCRDLLSRADTIRRICTDPHTGQVVAVDEPVPVHRDPDAIRAALTAMQSAPVTLPDLASAGYRPTSRALRFVRLRDRTCRFPGCTRPARYSDVDHRIPWPLGPTDPRNLHCLCRHHHRAKQSGLFTVHTEPDGSTVWTLTRTGAVYRRPPPAILPTL